MLTASSRLPREILAWDRFIRLVSLWEMIKTYAYDLVEITGHFHAYMGTLWFAAELHKRIKDPIKNPLDAFNLPVVFEDLENYLMKARKICRELELRSSAEHIEKTLAEWRYLVKQENVEGIADRLKEIRQRIEDDLKHVSFLLVPLSKTGYYDQPFFGLEVEEAFPDAIDDIREAGRCFAVGRYSGVVLHCMGIVQFGLIRFAKPFRLAIDIQTDDWNTIITKLEGAISIKKKAILAPDTKAAKSKWAKLEPYYAEIIADVRSIKSAWRNPGFHFRRRDFDETKALKVLSHVKDFMILLATGPNPKRRKGIESLHVVR
jgi:hypothetical protein